MLQSLVARLRGANDDEKGFTLIELLVVVLIIGILAAIALPTFLGQEKKGQDASAKSDARNMVSQVESCFTDTQTYASCVTKASLGTPTGLNIQDGATSADVKTNGTTTQGAVAFAAVPTTNGYKIDALSKSGIHYFITKDATAGTVSRTCGDESTTTNGACRNGGW